MNKILHGPDALEAVLIEWRANPVSWAAQFEINLSGKSECWSTMAVSDVGFITRSGTLVRRKPRTLTIGSFEVPEPMREAPEVGETFWLASMTEHTGMLYTYVHNVTLDRWIERGLCFHTKEDAELCAKALLSLLEGE